MDDKEKERIALHRMALGKPTAWGQQATYYKKYLERLENIYTIVELGVDYGFSFFTMAWDFPKALVIGIDNFCYDKSGSTDARKPHLETYLSNYPNARLLEGDTTTIGNGWKNSDMYLDVDVLHLDAGHDYEEVKADFEAWEPHVISGGVIMFHDIESFPDTVGKFFSELEGEKIEDGNLGIYYKP